MSKYILARSDEPGMDPQTMRGMFQFRHNVFREKLGWQVECRDGMEIDLFDDLNPVYALSKGQSNNIEGCWRLLPTTGKYMLQDTFPQLLRGEKAPSHPDIWELSRFAVVSERQGDLAQGSVSRVTFGMMRQIFEFAERQGIRNYVTVTSVAVERLFRRAGIPIRRFGDGKSMLVGKVLSVACWIDLNEETRQAVYRFAAETAREAA